MLSEVLKILVLFSFSCTINGYHEHCLGSELSINGTSEIGRLRGLLKKEPCVVVHGNIVIANLTDTTFPVEIYQHVRQVHGSIVIVTNNNIKTPIHFPSLQFINASASEENTTFPAIAITQNRNVKFSVGDFFTKAISSYRATFVVIHNQNVVIDKDEYNLWYLAAYPNGSFLTDSMLTANVCLENLFKPLAGILGFLFVALTVAFSTVAFYDRPKQL